MTVPAPAADQVSRRYATLTFVRGALAALMVALAVGLLSALYSVPALGESMRKLGIQFTALRPLHTIFASAWIFLRGMAVVHRFLQEEGGPLKPGERLRLRGQVLLWAFAGLGILITLPLGITSGREYMGHHPLLSIPIFAGWLLFCWNYFGIAGRGFWQRPVYVMMWAVGSLFFVYTFTEQHAYLLPGVFGDPVVDRQIQWKACGTLVGSFNLFVYGTAIFLGEKITGDKSYGQSRTAWALLGIGLLNSFTNYTHHTYHLPQSHLVKWIGFCVSMTELLILLKVVGELSALVRAESEGGRTETAAGRCVTRILLGSAKWWTAAMLVSSILISVPPLNALVHGTYVVTGHAMGTTIGIDTMILLAAMSWLLRERPSTEVGVRKPVDCKQICRTAIGLNIAAGALAFWLHFAGLVDGVTRYLHPVGAGQAFAYRPAWLQASIGPVFAICGLALFGFFVMLLRRWVPVAFAPFDPEMLGEPVSGWPLEQSPEEREDPSGIPAC